IGRISWPLAEFRRLLAPQPAAPALSATSILSGPTRPRPLEMHGQAIFHNNPRSPSNGTLSAGVSSAARDEPGLGRWGPDRCYRPRMSKRVSRRAGSLSGAVDRGPLCSPVEFDRCPLLPLNADSCLLGRSEPSAATEPVSR